MDYTQGISLYKAFTQALEAQDKARTVRLQSRLDNWYSALTEASRGEFSAFLVASGIIPADSELGKVIRQFNARFVDFNKN